MNIQELQDSLSGRGIDMNEAEVKELYILWMGTSKEKEKAKKIIKEKVVAAIMQCELMASRLPNSPELKFDSFNSKSKYK